MRLAKKIEELGETNLFLKQWQEIQHLPKFKAHLDEFFEALRDIGIEAGLIENNLLLLITELHENNQISHKAYSALLGYLQLKG